MELESARKMAKIANVKLPTHITTWTDGCGQFQMFYRENGQNVNGEYISGHCAADAKARFITKRVDRDAPDADLSALFEK
jgi:hypothetical protein